MTRILHNGLLKNCFDTVRSLVAVWEKQISEGLHETYSLFLGFFVVL